MLVSLTLFADLAV